MQQVRRVDRAWECTVNLPETWLALLPDASDGVIDEQVDARAYDEALASTLKDKLRMLREDLDERRALYGALTWQPDEIDGVYSANMLMFAAPRSAPGLPVAAEIRTLADALPKQRAGDVTPPAVSEVDLPAGPAVRVRVLAETSPDDDGATMVLDCVQFWLPLTEHDETLIFSFSTPNLALGDQLAEVFDRIATAIEVDEAVEAPRTSV